jgi:hypothetical protein
MAAMRARPSTSSGKDIVDDFAVSHDAVRGAHGWVGLIDSPAGDAPLGPDYAANAFHRSVRRS